MDCCGPNQNPSSRRHFLASSAFGIGSLSLAWLMQNEGLLAAPVKPELEPVTHDVTPKQPHHDPTATSMISLFYGGGPSHLDMFDPKPLLAKYDGKEIPEEIATNIKFDAGDRATRKVLASPYKFQKYGESGIEMSELLPYTSGIADDITLIRSMHLGGLRNHVAGMRAIAMGQNRTGLPGLGNWVTYGLGAESRDLPAFVAINMRGRSGNLPGKPYWLNGYLPSVYQGTLINSDSGITDLAPRGPLRGPAQKRFLELVEELNREHQQRLPNESDLEARIASYELAARMQLAATDVMDVSGETKETQRLYGLDHENKSLADYGYHLLVARRMIERGVRFVQVWDYGWDMHAGIFNVLPKKVAAHDLPTAGLIIDLKRRGLLDSTLVHCGGEMGRLPVMQSPSGTTADGTNAKNAGRDHNTDGFTMWLAGGGLKRGFVYGATDDFGHRAIENPMHHSDFHATVLHAFGLDPQRLTYTRNGQELSLVAGQSGRIVHDIFA
jgi:hypothetical protein